MRHPIFDQNTPINKRTIPLEKRLGYFTCELVVKRRLTKKSSLQGTMTSGDEKINTATVKNYVFGIQQVIRTEFCVLDFDILSFPAVLNVVENRFRELQSAEAQSFSHDTLSLEDCA